MYSFCRINQTIYIYIYRHIQVGRGVDDFCVSLAWRQALCGPSHLQACLRNLEQHLLRALLFERSLEDVSESFPCPICCLESEHISRTSRTLMVRATPWSRRYSSQKHGKTLSWLGRERPFFPVVASILQFFWKWFCQWPHPAPGLSGFEEVPIHDCGIAPCAHKACMKCWGACLNQDWRCPMCRSDWDWNMDFRILRTLLLHIYIYDYITGLFMYAR